MVNLAKTLCFTLCAAPLAWLGYLLFLYASGDAFAFGADPAKQIVLFLGEWALILLLVTLTVSPVQALVRWLKAKQMAIPLGNLVRYRRMLGLFAFAYAALHLMAYCVFLLELDFSVLWEDVVDRPYITVGALALVGMTALAGTSTNAMQRRLGKNWKKLHQLVYPISFLAIIHLFWQTRSDFTESLLYSAALALLMSHRVFKSKRVQEWFNCRKVHKQGF